MTHFFYIIYSPKVDKYYVGETSNLETRILIHRNNSDKNYTKISSEREYVLTYECSSKEIAIKLEKFVKK